MISWRTWRNWFVAMVESYYSTTLKFSELFRTNHSFKMFWKADYTDRSLTNCSNGTKNTWIQRLRRVTHIVYASIYDHNGQISYFAVLNCWLRFKWAFKDICNSGKQTNKKLQSITYYNCICTCSMCTLSPP